MHLNDTVCRINEINWRKVGTIVSNEDADLGYEFLRRLALFYKNEGLRPQPPMFTNIAKLLGDTENEFPIAMYCNPEVLEFIDDYQYLKKYLNFIYNYQYLLKKTGIHCLFKCI